MICSIPISNLEKLPQCNNVTVILRLTTFTQHLKSLIALLGAHPVLVPVVCLLIRARVRGSRLRLTAVLHPPYESSMTWKVLAEFLILKMITQIPLIIQMSSVTQCQLNLVTPSKHFKVYRP